MDRVIYHCDCNSFYCSVELLSRPELRAVPTAVCGDPDSRHGIILAKNEPAKQCGVRTAETIWQARRKCPGLTLLPAHHGLYRDYSRRVNAIYDRFTDLIEPFGIDESWLDVTGSLHLFGGDARALADRIRNTVREELGLTISVGVSFNKVFAKLAGTYTPPKSVGNGETFPRNLTRREEVARGVALLADQVAVRLRGHGLMASTLQVTIRDPAFKDICRQRPLPAPANTARELARAAMDILAQSWKPNAPIRALTLTAHNLIPEGEAAQQLDLFQSAAPQKRDKVEALERTRDAIRSKYGRGAVTVAALAPPQSPERDDGVPF